MFTETAFRQIPVIDFANASNSDPVLRRALAAELKDACTNVGFFYIKNHGIPSDVISATVDAAQSFFSLPLAAKQEIDIHKSPNFKGYTALLGENTDPANRGDLHEGFDIGWEPLETSTPSNGGVREDGAMAGVNVWPDVNHRFRQDVLTYYHAAVGLGLKLFPLFALALNLPEDWFNDKVRFPPWRENCPNNGDKASSEHISVISRRMTVIHVPAEG
ncbi:Clavaminate synthase-like protein [Coniophora puteana RWD-64-598 SS2]|uniref:Clavaminate synthase-like protein n=1 Tax=Coniophora puteana (strain RWD-64-598) TaxID=741705 RepID=A0A5M3MRC4_CONPW|nr:Clavaminate synthase-like protein [Coniophora puteana RWD-64-598 SS2]EIW81091.1 Clavaminate synthase-like protein [Coniophora puteana RWD-64-598 SS2]